MASRDYIEKALLLGVVKNKNWNLMILNHMQKKFFSFANHNLYQYIEEEFQSNNNYPDFSILQMKFNISDQELQECLDFDDYSGACKFIIDDYKIEYLKTRISELNEYQEEMLDNPDSYIERIGSVYKDTSLLSHHTQAVDLFDGIENQLGIEKETISTGFKELDEKLKGWQRGEELVVFMGRTGQGKSWLGLKFAMSAALQGEHVGIYSGEMSKEQLQERIICCAKQTYTSTREEAVAFIKEHNLSIKIMTQKELRGRASVADIENFIVENHLTMVIIDQLSLMEDNTCKPGTPLRQQYGNISMDLFTLTSRYSIPIILLVQSNRQGGENKNGPALENIAESDAVAQNATRVISMKNESGVLTLNILKNRYGNGNLVQRYDVDYGKNKYKPIQEINPQAINRQPTRNSNSVSSMFRTGRQF